MPTDANITWIGQMSSDTVPVPFFMAGLATNKSAMKSIISGFTETTPDLRWTDGPYPIDVWAANHGTEHPVFGLALYLDAQNPTVFGVADKGSPDLRRFTLDGDENLAKLDVISLGAIPPLGDQFGVFPAKTVPDELATTLFPENDGHLYAVMDAALMPGLVTRLEQEELTFRCLFKNDAAENLADVAPYLVELPKNCDLTRDLFTKTDLSKHYYGKDSCLYFRSATDFDALWAHLRKFTKIRNEEDKWYYLRFWDASFRRYIVEHPQGPFPRGIFDKIDTMICRLQDDQWHIANNDPDSTHEWKNFLPTFRGHFRMDRRRSFLAKVGANIESLRENAEPSSSHLQLLYRQARDRGFETERGIAKQMDALFLWRRDQMSEEKVLNHPALAGFETLSDPARAGAILETTLKILEYKR